MVERGRIARGANDIFGLGQFDDRSAGFLVGALQRVGMELSL